MPSFIPMMMFAILFGLSMDYEVFLLSRIREEYERTGDNTRSVADGLAATARVITAAAAIMVAVFGAFVAERPGVPEADRHRHGDRHPRGRHRRPHGAGPRVDAAARRPQLVAAPVARPACCPRLTVDGPTQLDTSDPVHDDQPSDLPVAA